MADVLPGDTVIRPSSDGQTIVSITANDLAAGLASSPSADQRHADTHYDVLSLESLDRYAGTLGLEHPSSELRLLRSETDDLGFMHFVYSQYWHNRPVFDARLIVHWNAQHKLYRIDGHYAKSPVEVLEEPLLDAPAAVSAALKIKGVKRQQLGQPELGIYTGEGRSPALAWRLPLSISIQRREWLTLDAGSGALLDRHAMAP